MIVLTDEQRRAIEQSGNEPVCILDPSTQKRYFLLNESTYELMNNSACDGGGSVSDWSEEELRREIFIGIQDADAGRVKTLSEELVDEIKRKGRERLAAATDGTK